MNTLKTSVPVRVSAELTHNDIFRVSLGVISKSWFLWGCCVFGVGASTWLQFNSEFPPTTVFEFASDVCEFTARWVSGVIAFTVVMALSSVLQSASTPGVYCVHDFEVRDEGLFESTTANQTLTYWSVIPRVNKSNHYIVIFPAWWHTHIIPRRAFLDEDSFEAFFHLIQQRINNSRVSVKVTS